MIRVAYDGRIHGALPNLVVGLVLHPTVYVHPSLRPSQKNSPMIALWIYIKPPTLLMGQVKIKI